MVDIEKLSTGTCAFKYRKENKKTETTKKSSMANNKNKKRTQKSTWTLQDGT